MRVLICSDTHVPAREPMVPEWVRAELAAADHVVHAGDFEAAETLERVRDLADGQLTAVRGNVDRSEIDLPQVAEVELGGVTFVVTHGDRLRPYRRGLAELVRERGGPDAVGVGGHTHEPMDEIVDGIRLLNPGSATGNRAAATTVVRGTVDAGNFDATLLSE
jgi:putative phosphoesterase